MLGEIQLGAILKEILSPEQYEENIVTKKVPETLLSLPLSFQVTIILLYICL